MIDPLTQAKIDVLREAAESFRRNILIEKPKSQLGMHHNKATLNCIEELEHMATELEGGTVRSGWIHVDQSKPETLQSVIVAGVLEDESVMDSHEGFWDGKTWLSIRRREDNPTIQKRIVNVTHWMRRPQVPAMATELEKR